MKEHDDGVPHIGKSRKELLQKLARDHGTPIFVIDHEKIRSNYREFKKSPAKDPGILRGKSKFETRKLSRRSLR